VEDLELLLQGEAILATPFRKGREGDDMVKVDDLTKVHQQLNYTNTALTTLSTQLNHVSICIEETKKQVQISSNPPESLNYANSMSKPFF